MLKPVARTCELAAMVVLSVLVFFWGSNSWLPVRFDQEKIEVWASSGQVHVIGNYHYVNASILLASSSLSLPFPIDSNHPRPSTYSIRQEAAGRFSNQEIATHTYHGHIVFRLCFFPLEEKWIRVEYTQGTRVSEGRYILVTTRKWGRPLDRGEYVLHLRPEMQLVSSNYSLAAESSGETNVYAFSETDFFPSQDWEFQWAEPSKSGNDGVH
jgi:hypothetical protein